MPSSEAFDATLVRLHEAASDASLIDRYGIAAKQAGLHDQAEPDTDDFDHETYEFIRHALARIEADLGLTTEERDQIVAELLALYTYNTDHNDQVVWNAYNDHVAAAEAAFSEQYDTRAFRLFGLVVLSNTPLYRGSANG